MPRATRLIMTDKIASIPSLAPLQRVMLEDSLFAPGAGHHVEQLEIGLFRDLTSERVLAAWTDTVARTEALRIAFLTINGRALGWERVTPRNLLDLVQPKPLSWESWLAADRCLPLLVPHKVPWRAAYWHGARRFIWTFHHALLDGRSIARIVRGFRERLIGGKAEDLALSGWRDPSPKQIGRAEIMFREIMVNSESAEFDFPPENDGRAVRCLGRAIAMSLDSLAAALAVTPGTVLTWAWGQALAQTTGTGAVLLEQLRAGAPQPGTAGFTMNTLPVSVRLAAASETAASLQDLQARLLARREIEAVSPADFPPGVHPNMDGPGSSTIMIERATLQHLAGGQGIESLVLHEAKGESLMATGYLLPDLRLEVEGPGRHCLLEAWIAVLERLGRDVYPA